MGAVASDWLPVTSTVNALEDFKNADTWQGKLESGFGLMAPIKAYHGSPHDFDRFSMDKIGTGEGAQAYGHGLYFAEKEGVAKSYRDQLAKPPTPTNDAEEAALNAWDMVTNYGQDPVKLAADLRSMNDPALEPTIQALETGAYQSVKPGGHMYEVNINAEPDDFLDWDKPLRDQPEFFNKFTSAYGGEDALLAKAKEFEEFSGRVLEDPSLQDAWDAMRKDPQVRLGGIVENNRKPVNPFGYDAGSKQTGESLYRAMAPDKTEAAAALREAGIPGIRYLDQGSRPTNSQLDAARAEVALLKAKGFNQSDIADAERHAADLERKVADGSRNYVVFDDKLIDIARKYGIALPGLGLAKMGSTYGTSDE
jgi:hypothetical protein